MIILPPLHGILKQGSGSTVPPEGWTMAAPYITGVTTSGETLTAHVTVQDPMPEQIRWQWQEDNVDIPGQTSGLLLLSDLSIGHRYSVIAYGQLNGVEDDAESPQTEIVRAAAPPEAAPVNTVLPQIIGTARVGQTLTGSPGQWTGWPVPIFTHRWEADGTPISGATDTAYTLTVAEFGKVITFVEIGTNSQALGGVEAESLPTNAVQVQPATPNPGLYINVGGMETGSYWDAFTIVVGTPLIQELRDKGFRRGRLTLDGSRIQPQLFGPLNPSYIGYIKTLVDFGASIGFQFLLDIHDFGGRTIEVVASTAVVLPVTDFTDWTHFQSTGVVDGVIENTASNTHNQSLAFAVTAGEVVHSFKIAAKDRPFLHLIGRGSTGIHPSGQDYDALFDLRDGTIVGQNATSSGRATIAPVPGETGFYEVTLRSTIVAAGTETIIVEGGDADTSYANWIATKRVYVGNGSQPLTVARYSAVLNTSTVKGAVYGTAELPYTAAGDLTGKFCGWVMANCNMDGVHGFETMNEPHTQTADGVFQLQQTSINAARAAGWPKWMIVGGIPWQNGPTFWTLNPNLWKLVDPLGMLEFHAHGYPDFDSSGSQFGPEAWGVPRQEGPAGAVTDVNVVIDRFRNFIEGCEAHGLVPGMGETGNDNTGGQTSLDCFQITKDYVIARGCSWYLWATGPAWGPGYGYFIGTKANGLQNETMVVIDDHFGNPAPTKFAFSGPSRMTLGGTGATCDIEYNGRITTPERIDFSDGGAGGTFSPPFITLPAGRNAKAEVTYIPNGQRIVLLTASSASGWTETTGGFYFSSENDTLATAEIDYSRAENVISLNRQLVATYLGPLFTAYRNGDGATLDVYPVGQAVNVPNVGKEVDRAAVLAWGLQAGSTGAQLLRAYDQAPGSTGLAANLRHDVTTAIQNNRTPVATEYPFLALDKRGQLEARHTTATKMRLLSHMNVTGKAMVAKYRLDSGNRFIAWEHTYTNTSIGAGISQAFTANAGTASANKVSNDRNTFALGVRKGEEHVYAFRWRCAVAATQQRIGGWKSWRDGATVAVQNSQATKWNVDYGAHDACMGWFRSTGVGTFTGAWSEIILFNDTTAAAAELVTDAQLLAVSADVAAYYKTDRRGMAAPKFDFNFRTASYTVSGGSVPLTNYMTGVVRDANGADLTTSTTIQAVGALLDVFKTKQFAILIELGGTATTSGGSGNSHDFLAATHSGGAYTMGRLNSIGRLQMTGVTTGGANPTVTGSMLFGYAVNSDDNLVVAHDGATYPVTQLATFPWANAITAVQLLKSYSNTGLKCRSIKVWDVTERNALEVVRAFNQYGNTERGADLSSGYYLGPNWGMWFNNPGHTYGDAYDAYAADYYRSYGCNITRTVIRRTVLQNGIEVAWGRRELAADPTTFTPRAGFITNLRKWVDKTLDVGMDVILDWHTFGNVNQSTGGNAGYTDEMWAMDMAEMARQMPNSPRVWIEIANEPGGVYPNVGDTVVVTPTQYADFQIACITAIRATGFIGPIVISPYGSNGDVSQIEPQGDQLVRCIDADPLNNIVISGHDYFQSSGYDGAPDTVTYGDGTGALAKATRWARRMRAAGKNVRLQLGEGGIPWSATNDGGTQREGEERLWFTSNNRDVWIVQTLFSGGANSPAYTFDNFVQFYNEAVKGERLSMGLLSQYGVPSDLSEAAPGCNVLPSISGSSIQGQVVTCFPGDWDRATNPFTYLWYRANANTGVKILPATGVTTQTYAQGGGDVGFRLICDVTSSNEFGSTTVPSTTSAVCQTAAGVIAPSFSTQPSISGTLTVGSTLTLSLGTIAGFPVPTTATVFRRNGYPIEGTAGTTTYVLTTADLGKAISATVVASNIQGSATGTAPARTIPDASPTTIRITAGAEISVSDVAAETANVYAIAYAASPLSSAPQREVMVMDYDTGDRIVMTLITDDGWATASKEIVTWKTHAQVAFDSTGRCWRCSVDQLPSQTAISYVDIGSTTWSAYAALPQLLTRVTMAIDTGASSPFKDRIYVGGRVGDAGGCTIMAKTSFGWAPITITGTSDFNQGKLHSLSVGADGTLYGLWAARSTNINNPDGSPNGQSTQFYLVTSINGGGTLSVRELYRPRSGVLQTAGNLTDDANLVCSPVSDTLHLMLRESGANGQVTFTYLRSDTSGGSWVASSNWAVPTVPSGWGVGGHHLACNAQGHLLLQYYAQSGTTAGTAARYAVASKNDGLDWSAPVAVNGSNWTQPVSTTQRELLGGDRHTSDVRVGGGFVGVWTSHLTSNNRYNARIRPLTVS